MARRLLDAGYPITGYNRTRAKAQNLLDAGMGWADCPRAVAETSDVVFSMDADTMALRAITAGPDGILVGLRPHTVYVDMSTVSPEASKAVASHVR
jgi:3-hydroxyisobutyrate dehydrogenase-like beta-hydroxyacid dehydrogenase